MSEVRACFWPLTARSHSVKPLGIRHSGKMGRDRILRVGVLLQFPVLVGHSPERANQSIATGFSPLTGSICEVRPPCTFSGTLCPRHPATHERSLIQCRCPDRIPGSFPNDTSPCCQDTCTGGRHYRSDGCTGHPGAKRPRSWKGVASLRFST